MKISQFVLSLILFIVSLTMNSFEKVTPDPNSRWPFNVHETSPNLCSWSLLTFQKPHLAASGTGHTSLTLGNDPAWQAVHLQFLWTTWRNQPETGSPRGRQPRLGREETQSVNTTLFPYCWIFPTVVWNFNRLPIYSLGISYNSKRHHGILELGSKRPK